MCLVCDKVDELIVLRSEISGLECELLTTVHAQLLNGFFKLWLPTSLTASEPTLTGMLDKLEVYRFYVRRCVVVALC